MLRLYIGDCEAVSAAPLVGAGRCTRQMYRVKKFPEPVRGRREQIQPEAGSEWAGSVHWRCFTEDICLFSAGWTRWVELKLWRASGIALWDRKRFEALKELEWLKHVMHRGWAVA